MDTVPLNCSYLSLSIYNILRHGDWVNGLTIFLQSTEHSEHLLIMMWSGHHLHPQGHPPGPLVTVASYHPSGEVISGVVSLHPLVILLSPGGHWADASGEVHHVPGNVG